MARRPLSLTAAALCLLPLAAARADEARPVELAVDASEAPRGLIHARLTVPAKPGPLTLYFPKWIPGTHGPTGPIGSLAGLRLKAAGKDVPWHRDEEDMYAFHCEVPEGAAAVDVELDHAGGGRGGRGASSDKVVVIRWNEMLLYPAGRPIQSLPFRASLRLPEGWKSGTALPSEGTEGATTRYQTVPLETLVDSPVIAGAYFRTIELGTGGGDGPRHYIHLACDSPGGLEMPADIKAKYERLVAEAGALFGSRHYRSYHFLVALGDQIGYGGLEHHESSDNGLPEKGMVDAQINKAAGDLLPHEFVHSWNGKYRRPAGLVKPDYQAAERTRLVWIYEGLTHYLGKVLAARSGIWTPEEFRDNFAVAAQAQRGMRGRAWRPLEDTAVAAPLNMVSFGGGWPGWRRGADYYDEGALLWLEADTLIRQQTNGAKSLDDFCRLFYGGSGGRPEVKPYEQADVMAALNEVCPYDWKGFWDRRLTLTADDVPLAGIEQGGWKLGYGPKPSALESAADKFRKQINLSGSLGLVLTQEGGVSDVMKAGPADRAGVAPGMKLLAINGRKWNPERLNEAVASAKEGGPALELLMENGEYLRTHRLDYHGGARFARLERAEGKPDLLAEIGKPLKPAEKPAGGGAK
jgi:predicted metalloprotease with PDZ domain